MDRSQSRLLVVLAALVIAVAAALTFSGAPRGAGDPDATAVIWNIDAEDAVKIRVERASGVIRLEKQGSMWLLREPFDEPADPMQVDDLISALHNVRNGIPIDVPAARAAEFGLGAPPNARVSFTLPDGTERHLEVGFEAPTGFRTYVRDANGDIAAVTGDLNRPLQAEADRYRDPRVVHFDPERVRGLTLPGAFAVAYTDGGWWVEGLGPADPDAVRALIDRLSRLRYEAYGVKPEEGTDWELLVEGGPPIRMRVGPATPDGVPVSGPDGRGGWVAADELPSLRGADVLAASALGIALDRTDRVEVRMGGRAAHAVRNGEAWQSEGRDDGDTWTWVAALARARPVPRAAGEALVGVASAPEALTGRPSGPVRMGVQDCIRERPDRTIPPGTPSHSAFDPCFAGDRAEFAVELIVTVGEGGKDRTIEIGARLPDGTRPARWVGAEWFTVESEPFEPSLAALR